MKQLIMSAVAALVMALPAWAGAWKMEREPTFVLIDRPKELALLPHKAINPIGEDPPPGTGQDSVMVSDLLNQSQEVVGVHNGNCTTTTVNGQLHPEQTPGQVNLCTHAFTLHGKGKLIMEGPVNRTAFHDGEAQTIPITGGTGKFLRARGEAVTYESSWSPNVHIFEIYLTW